MSTVKIDATILKQDASTVSIDLSTLTSDIGAVTQDVAAMKNDLANLTASGLPATPGATAAIAAAGKAIGQAAAKANGEIDQVNADVTQAYSIADGMATGSCVGDGPGRPPGPSATYPATNHRGAVGAWAGRGDNSLFLRLRERRWPHRRKPRGGRQDSDSTFDDPGHCPPPLNSLFTLTFSHFVLKLLIISLLSLPPP